MSEHKEYARFDVTQRLEHWLMVLSFTVLAVTGIPQKFAGDGWAEAAIALMGGIEIVRLAHHVAAIVLLLESIYHVAIVLFRVVVLRTRWTMFPQLQDVWDALGTVRYNLGRSKEPPRMGRFAFGEKFEYWALVWGTLIMALTGFMLWNPIISSRWLGGDLIPAAKAAHGGEAILAVLAVLVWHLYHVHVKTFNRAMLSGKLGAHEMAEEHAEEKERIDAGIVDSLPLAETIKTRRALFVPVTTLVAILLLYGVYLFVTAETTAVSTIPLPPPGTSRQQVFVPRPPTATPTRAPTATPAAVGTRPAGTPGPQVSPTPGGAAASLKPLPQSHAGRAICQACHATGINNSPKNPPDHAGRLDASCKDCHRGP